MSAVVNPRVRIAPAMSCASAYVVLVSHGYELIYERGFCNGVADAGVQCTLIGSDRTDPTRLRPGVTVVNLRGSQAPQRSRLSKLLNLLSYHLRLVWLVASRRPVVHVFGLIYPPVLVGIVEGCLFRLLTPRYILTAHDLLPHDRHDRWHRWVFGLSYRLADRVVVHTERMRADMVAMHGVNPARVVLMEHGIEPLAASSLPMPASARSEGWATGPKLLFFGKVMRYKGLDLLLQALQDFPQPFQLRIAGACHDSELTQALEAAIAAHPGRACIRWDNRYIEDAEIPGLFAWADITVLPYRHIGQSGILFQSLRYGVPVVAAQVGAFETYVTRPVGETFPRDDAAGCREAVLRLWHRRAELDRAAVAGAGTRWEWGRTARALLPAYRLEDGSPA